MARDALEVAGGRLRFPACAAALWACALAPPCWGSNGLNMIGFGAESVLMGGADAALARDTTALNTNPAGLAGSRGSRQDLFTGLARALDVGHADAFGNDLPVSNRWALIAGGGHTRPLAAGWFIGAGFFVQGGAGARFERLNTAFGTQDELTALTGIAKAALGLGWQASEQLSLGVSLSAVYAGSQQRVFPQTSLFDPTDVRRSFFGTRLDGASTLQPGLRWGLQWRPHADWVLAAVAAPRVPLPLSGGTLTVNYGALGLGAVRYRSVRLDGLSLPREYTLGAAWQASPQTLISVKVSRLAWARALADQTLEARAPDVAAAPPVVRSTQRVQANDRTLVAWGLRQMLSPGVAVLAGFNRMRRPLFDASLSPLFAPIGENHLTFGLNLRPETGAELTAGVEVLLPRQVRYNNPDLPFGRDTQARTHYVALHAMWSWRW